MNKMKKLILLPMLIFVVLILMITGCSELNMNSGVRETATLLPIPSLEPTKTYSSPTSSQEPSESPSISFSNPITINVTQMPIFISTGTSIDAEYLYKEAKVTFSVPYWNGAVFLNLDDLNNNDQQNSDFIIYIDTGSAGTTLEIYPTNFARYYFSGKKSMDYKSCTVVFPKSLFEESKQFEILPPIDIRLISGNAFCILSNEGRMSVVNMLENSLITDDQGNMTFSLIVTVYNSIVTDLLIPAPSETIGPSPTPTNRYSARNISDPEQIQKLDNSIQSFIDAIKESDKTAIANMIVYPLYLRLPTTGDVTIINSPTDFIMRYEEIFPQDYESGFAKTTIEKNIKSYPGTIALECEFGEIDFTDYGQIDNISVSLFK